MQFEVKAEEDDRLKAFLPEVVERLSHMVKFKKAYCLQVLTVEKSLKQVAPMMLTACECIC